MPDLDHLLERTSRTFALSIPRLPEPTRTEVTVAYLLFRIADTFEDASASPPDERIAALEDLASLLRGEGRADAPTAAERWLRSIDVSHDGYRELLEETPFVLETYRGLRPEAERELRRHLLRTVRGMEVFVERSRDTGELRLADLDELRHYCYVVAGIVGEMLTELFLLGRDGLREVGPYLRERSRAFGEGLQLVNVLKDAGKDTEEGRRYLPPSVGRDRVFSLAREDLERAAEYTLALQEAGAESGVVAFNALPVKLAWATLDVVEREGPGSKISRTDVWRLVGETEAAIAEGRPVISTSGAGRAVG
ncbi:MAG: squalene/phytoene synthase family protein [Gemmatimonadetes bacterium]|nr:squalene/phytoene synthase family protein [Gemmatimonadota bacterium]NIR78567.1 squalene/phytoene synthase family protein [Gemmatimonadota bacterium]NIT86568.1 squalene/phytoene synthase family protein [Gemmatimonadota bacterium]NIU31021.1 squalene/phytoene synthase family protein [Gemmatimonadota bacterium]NIU35775.1 squalene/phytoene synthase family protein [Gemmatimonadota bacterium]